MPVFDPLPSAPSATELPLHLWGREAYEVEPWGDTWQIGYNSHTWLLQLDSGRHVLKAVPRDQGVKFASGLEAALLIDGQGVPSGAPLRTVDGAVAGYAGEWCWALLDYVGGTPADPADPEQLALVGRTLGRIHTGLRELPPLPGVMTWGRLDWLLVEEPFLEGRPWIQQAIRESLAALPDELTVGMIHCDPRVTEFRIDQGRAGIFDWGEAMYAPHVFDLATTLSFLDDDVDSKPFLSGYLTESVISAEELAYIPAALKLRAGIEAWIYARRLHFGVDLGQQGEHTNATLIERARTNIAAAELKDRTSYLP
ncbi:phosphotransferase enzyme family protein [Kitasatospora sp. NPDC018058]|uniref:phosphotransferase enzyme family protein n=1 Tax=Kitasatospora sp. NPDC018058 TaxID=3364025 RepID=UPI0037BE70F4